jgi:DNA-directed RNA polymerase subunit RPC12/RpoP
MRVMKLAVVLCFAAALVMMINYPRPVAGQVAPTKAPARFADGLRPAYTSDSDVSAAICANCHQTLNHLASLATDDSGAICANCHQTINHVASLGIDVSAVVCANCHQTVNHVASLAMDGSAAICANCHSSINHIAPLF